ncbi:hypothetical protein DL96DRAFT_1686347 [Flagelloscypha sp. PMI_526]|nr:hypothetical protein DL96DRAFT_1686347 [Flagelloscypha sp. PMI_526]
MSYDTHYQRLARDEEEDVAQPPKSTVSRKHLLWIALILNALQSLCILFLLLRQQSAMPRDQQFYSPAQHVVEYIPSTFMSSANHGTTEYQGAGPEVDRRWTDLYDYGISIITEEEALPLVNETEPISLNGEPTPVVQLSVFHQLHCVNMLRKSIYPEVYPPAPGASHSDPTHLSHCIDILRQGVQCASDISPFGYTWVEEKQEMLLQLHVVHSCRNFEKLKEWALPREIRIQLANLALINLVLRQPIICLVPFGIELMLFEENSLSLDDDEEIVSERNSPHSHPFLSSENHSEDSYIRYHYLPSELLIQVFSFLVQGFRHGSRPLIALDNPTLWIPCILHVCSQWRQAALECSPLWSDVYVGKSAKLTNYMIKCSHPHPIHIFCADNVPWADRRVQEEALAAAMEEPGRLQAVYFLGPHPSISYPIFPISAPILEHVILRSRSLMPEILRGLSLLLGRANSPQLKTLVIDIHSTTLTLEYLPNTLTRLELVQVELRTQNDWIHYLPLLEILHLERLPWSLVQLKKWNPFHLPRLLRLVLKGMNLEQLVCYLELARVPNCIGTATEFLEA